jgi:hypothetical protein
VGPAGLVAHLCWVLLHLVQEVARHAGHLDVLREQIDGMTVLLSAGGGTRTPTPEGTRS